MKPPGLAAIILSVDPGKATGWAITEVYDAAHIQAPTKDLITSPYFHKCYLRFVEYGTILTVEDASTQFNSIARSAQLLATTYDVPLKLITEKFVITKTAMQKNTTWSSEVTGIVRNAVMNVCPTATYDDTQKPTEMKNLVHKNKLLHELGLKRRGARMTTHESDALGHAILYAARLSKRITRL